MAVFAEFVLSAAAAKQFPEDGLPEIALVGRSNVGKSSMINALLRMGKLARTSNTPGRTQTLNFYRIWPEGRPRLDKMLSQDTGKRLILQGPAIELAHSAGAFYFVDMPGYGFARVSQGQRQAWGRLIEQYLQTRPNLQGTIQLVDLRHPPTHDDIAMWEWLQHFGKMKLCLATKADKVPRNQQPTHIRQIVQDLHLAAEELLSFSAEQGLGREALWDWVTSTVRSSSVEVRSDGLGL